MSHVSADQLLLAANATSTSKPSSVGSVEVDKQKVWDQLDEAS